ncbi:MAG: S-layer homology domain-containing protein [Clostridia bacterium]|nr:S-layer homology domain-containing protein [Clostridia bacterium]
MKKLLSAVLVLVMVISLVPVTYAADTIGQELKNDFLSAGISKPEKGYIQTIQHLNKDEYGAEDYTYGYLGTDISLATYMPQELYAVALEREKLGDEAFMEKYGIDDEFVFWQIDMRLDGGPWQYDTSWDEYVWNGLITNNTSYISRSYKNYIEDIRNTGCYYYGILGGGLKTGTNHNDGEEGAYFDFGSHRIGFRVRYGLSIDNYYDDEDSELIFSPWSDEISYGKNGNPVTYSKPTSIPAPTISDLEFVYDEWDNDYDISFMIDAPESVDKDRDFFDTYGGGGISGIYGEISINNGDWEAVAISGDWEYLGKRWFYYTSDELGFTPGDNIKLRVRITGYTYDDDGDRDMYSPWSNVIEAGAKVIEQLPDFGSAPTITAAGVGVSTPSSVSLTVKKPDELKAFTSALNSASDKADFLSNYNLSDFGVYAQISFAIDEPDDYTDKWEWNYGDKAVEDSEWEYVRLPVDLGADSDVFEILNIGSAWDGSWTDDETGWKNVIKDGVYSVDNGKITIDYREHTLFLWVRYYIEYKTADDTSYRSETSYWTDRFDYGQEYVQPTSLDAPTVTGLTVTDEKYLNYPYIEVEVPAPASVLAAQREAVKFGDDINLVIEASVAHEDFVRVINTSYLDEGTYRFSLNEATELTTILDGTPLLVRARYYYADRNYEVTPANVFSDYSPSRETELYGLHNHNWDLVSDTATCTEDGVRTYECTECHERTTEKSDKLGHSYGDFVIEKEPTYTEKGLKVYTCTRCGHRDEYELDLVPHIHEFVDAGVAPTCTEDGYVQEECRICKIPGDYTFLPKLGHDFAKDYTVDVQPTYHSEGSKSRHCLRCSETTDVTVIPALVCEHDYKETVVPATCTADGYVIHECPICGDKYTTEPTPLDPALGHAWSTEWTVDVQPTLENEGRKSFHCLRCGAIDESSVTVLPVLEDTTSKYKDIKSNKWYKDAVDFVVGRGLMNGTSADLFQPDLAMNRAMLVTVLYRVEGSPATTATTPFTDLRQSWYKDAVAWAYENNIVNGISETKFGPEKPITREQMAAILYRYSDYKKYDISEKADVSSFPDYAKISSYALEPLQWAVKTNIIGGTSGADGKTYVDPKGNATRAQVATILMRYCKLMGV